MSSIRLALPLERGRLLTFVSVAGLGLLLFWGRYEAYWARYTAPRIYVRWSETVTGPTREGLETAYRLTEARQEEGTTWSYVLADTTTDNIRRLIADPAAADTHNIDRRRFEPAGENSPGPLEGRYWLFWAALLSSAVGLLAAWIGPERLRRAGWMSLQAAGAAMTRGVPEGRAEVLGFFRFFYAACLFLLVLNGRLVLEAGRLPDDPQLGWAWLGWLASRPDLMASVELGLLALLVPFAIGLWTSIVYRCFTAIWLIWVFVWIESQHSNANQFVAVILMVVCLLPVPWGAALSVDAALRRRRGEGDPGRLRGRVYAYPMWIPGLIQGTIWASAAYSKLNSSGMAWILGGAVKYHWVIDAPTAPVDWGLWVASHHWAAVFMSFCGVFSESVFILSVFVKPGRWRLLLTAPGLVLRVGFFLFQGVFWWGWWLAFLSFVIPWEPLYDVLTRSLPRPAGRAEAPAPTLAAAVPGSGLRPVHLALVVLVCLHPMFDLPAGFGRFGSYSGTYASTEEFDRINPIDPVDRVWVGYGSPHAREVEGDIAAAAICALVRHESLALARAAELRRLKDVQHLFADVPKRLTLTRQRKTFDWVNGRFNPLGPAVVIATLDLESMALVEDREASGSPGC